MNKVVIITGASRGIGKEMAIQFARHHFHVVINYLHSKEEAESLAAQLKKEELSYGLYQADVSSRSEVDAMVAYAIATFGRIDVLINNAGISEVSLFTDLSEDQWDRMINVNLKGAFNCTQSVLRHMLPNKQGKIINMSSIWGMVGGACEVHYSVSKAGLIGMTKALAKELGPSNIHVNCIAPGIVDTEMLDHLSTNEKEALVDQTALGRLGTAGDVAKCALFLASDDSNYLTGQVISPNGGYLF